MGKKYIIGFKQYGVELEGNSWNDLLNAYLRKLGGAQNAFNYIMRNLQIIEDNIKDIEPEIKQIDNGA